MKVRTTEEQEEAKKKERAAKVQIYRQLTSRIYEKVNGVIKKNAVTF